DPAAVEPACALGAEDRVPVQPAGPQLRDGRVPAVRAPDRAADAEPALGEVEAVANGAADTVERHPDHVRGVDAAGEHQVLDKPADRVVGERRDDGGLQPEAPAEATGDGVLAAALPDIGAPRRRDPAVARVEPQHHLAERDELVAALVSGPKDELVHRADAARAAASAASSVTRPHSPARSRSGLTIQLPPQATTCGIAR